ncbi:MAG: folate family ECF transporter S component [Selenomonadaceae bacterium]|nr:folate family ECF transporter S component [Selenomonadaceae bacterium]
MRNSMVRARLFSVKRTRELVLLGVFTSLTVLLARVFAIQTPFVHFGLSFLPVALCAAWLGPVKAGTCAALADILGANLLGTGAYFPGFTVSAFFTGWLYGIFFYRRRPNLWLVLAAFLLVTVFVHLLLNTVWLVLFYEKGASLILAARVPKLILCYPLECALFFFVWRYLSRILPHGKSF